MQNLKAQKSQNAQKYISRNGLKYRVYTDGTEAVKLVLTIHDLNFISQLETAVLASGRGRGAPNRLTEEFILNAIKEGHKF